MPYDCTEPFQDIHIANMTVILGPNRPFDCFFLNVSLVSSFRAFRLRPQLLKADFISYIVHDIFDLLSFERLAAI